jgi:hypothetical protein
VANLPKVVDCTKFDCTTPGATLAQAAAANALVPGALLRDIGAYPGVTLGDVLALLLGSAPTQWESLPLEGLQPFASEGGTVTYTAAVTIQGTGGSGLTDLSVKLPDGALYVPESTQLTLGGDAVPLAEPVQDGQDLTWSGVSLLFDHSYQLVFKAHSGFDLGNNEATASVAAAGFDTKTSAPADVQIVDTFEQNGTAATAQAVTPDTLYISYTTSGSDADYYSFPMPAAGSRVKIFLSHLHADEDLVVLGPGEAPLRSAPLGAIPLGAIATGDSTVALDQQGQALTPDTLNDVPLGAIPTGDSVLGVSDNRGTADEEVDFGSAGQSGVVTIRVNHYGSRPTDVNPYMLRVEVTPPPVLPCTTTQQFAHAGEGTPGVLPASVPANAQTLILVDEKRIGDTYGAAAETSVVSKLQTLAARGDVQGTILPVEGSPAVAAAYATWDAEPCSPAKANAVVRAIGTLLDPIQQTHPNLKSIVIVGTDEIVPMARLLDSTEIANETGFWPTLGFNNNEYVGAAANGFLLSDDPYGDPDPQEFLGGQLYVPKVALGRLVETPTDITNQIDQFIANNGAVAPKSEFTTGYDFLTDGSQAVASALNADGFPGGADQIRDDWSHTDLVNGIFPGGASPAVDSLNAHYDQHRALPALGNLQHNENDLFNSTEVATRGAGAVAGRIVFTMGCHSGFSLFDGLYPAYPAQDPDGFALDWPQTYLAGGAVAFMGNTGFGLGDTAAVAYSERLNQLFAQRLDGTMTIGQALEFAKQEYFGDLGVISLYDGKVGNEATLYGLPMTRIGNGTPPAAPAPLPATTDPTTGLLSTSFDVQPTFTRVDKTIEGATRTYFTVGGRTQVTNRRPIQPLTTLDVTQPGAVAHGALLTALTSHDVTINAAFSRVVMASTANEPPLGGDVAFPSKPQSIGTLQTPNGQQQRLVLIPGQFRSDDASTSGQQRLFDRLQGTVFYSNSNDFTEPTVANVQALKVGDRVAFSAEVADPNGVKEVVVLYRDSTGTWRRADLGCSAGRCSGGGPLSGNAVDYFAQAVDGAGNVGVSSFKATLDSTAPPNSTGHITITLDGTKTNGWFSGAVKVTATGDTGVDLTYSVDGNPFKAYSAPFTVSGDGVHIVEVRGSDGSDAFATVTIDGTAPTIRFTTPVNGAVFLAGDRILADYSCVDGGSGIVAGGCVGDVAVGQPISTTEGSHTFKVTATDAAGHVTKAQVTYNVWPFKGFLFPVKNPPAFNLAPAGIIVPFIFSVGGNRGMNIFESGYPKSQQIPCDNSSDVVGLDTTKSFAGLGLIFIPIVNQYVYLWKTDRAWAGTCRQFVIKFPNGSFRRANFKFK